MDVPVFLTLGSNIHPEQNLPAALGLLRKRTHVQRVSRFYKSLALGKQGEPLDQNYYLNAAVLLHVALGTDPVLFKSDVLRPLERLLGRRDTPDKYAPRPIDLDIALFGNVVIAPHLPDPEIYTRAYKALPLADTGPTFAHPVTGESLSDIAARFADAASILDVYESIAL